MLSGYGVGILYLSDHWLSKQLPIVGWRSVNDPDKLDPTGDRLENNSIDDISKNRASALELGCSSFPTIFSVGASAEFLLGIGTTRIEERILYLGEILIKKLQSLSFEIASPFAFGAKYRSGITIISIKGGSEMAEKLVGELASQKIYCAARGKGIRVSIHIYNNENDIDTFISALQTFSKQ